MAMFIVKPWYRKKDDAIYGAEWAGTSDPSWVRTDAAVGFADPNPYYSGMSTTPSSPFDNIMPWSGMRRVTDASAGELVEIPKFYYKWTRDGIKMKLQISMSQFDGSHVSPAHADRGDGVGERDYVYVGRYHCASDYLSKTNVLPKNGEANRPTFRTEIHKLGTNIYQNDFALWWTIRMLYLVEFASWDCQTKIGYGCGNGSSLQNTGSTDNMPYHTGTVQSSRTTYGVGIQYRYIEDLWAGVLDYIDGITINTQTIGIIYNPNNFADNNGTTMMTDPINNTSGSLKSMNNPAISGYEWFAYPNSLAEGYPTSESAYSYYICCSYSHWNRRNSATIYSGGLYYSQTRSFSLFYMNCNDSYDAIENGRGSRLMVLPPSRLSA